MVRVRMQNGFSSVFPMPWTDLLLHSAWTKCWNDNATVAAVVFSGPELLSSSSCSSCTSFSWCSSCCHHCLYAGGVAEGGSACGTEAHTAMHLLAKFEGQRRSKWRGTETETVSVRDRKRAGHSERKRLWEWVSWSMDGRDDRRYHAGHLCRGLWDQTQLNTQRVNRDPRSLFFSHRVQRCVFVLW